MNFLIKVAAAACVIAGATGAIADSTVPPGNDGFTKFGEVGDWNVFVDNERRSCLIERASDNNVVQMGLTKDHQFGYLGVFAKGDTGITSGEKEEIFIVIDDAVFSSVATGMKGNVTEGYSGGYILANNPEFIDAVANKHEMIVFPEKEAMFAVDLTGTKKAMEMARTCNAEQGG
ncbi:hypothetical protein ACFMPD_02120 [Sedimentitalea sp. HM32M-2]|uniref:hypothetical protein n=1 Tax=Sedimentitalea sp. HM32M-2 TaxID=3351566 RepID=UPI00362A72A9